MVRSSHWIPGVDRRFNSCRIGNPESRPPLFYYIFDMPQHEGEDLRSIPLEDRQARIIKWIQRRTGVLRISEVLHGDGNALLEQARKLGLEGLIGKKANSLYEVGRRSGMDQTQDSSGTGIRHWWILRSHRWPAAFRRASAGLL